MLELVKNWIESEKFFHSTTIRMVRQVAASELSTTFILYNEQGGYVVKFYEANYLRQLYQLDLIQLLDQLNYQERIIIEIAKDIILTSHLICINGNLIQNYKNYLIYVYEYIKGDSKKLDVYDRDQIYYIGQVLAVMHDINYRQYKLHFWENKKRFDGKPKNIIWMDTQKCAIIDWESMALIFRSTDFLNTLLAFSYSKTHNRYIP